MLTLSEWLLAYSTFFPPGNEITNWYGPICFQLKPLKGPLLLKTSVVQGKLKEFEWEKSAVSDM